MVQLTDETASTAISQAASGGNSPKMDAALKAKWIEALRSGEYIQYQFGLFGKPNNLCCLGVLWAVCGRPDDWRVWDDPITATGHRQLLIAMNDGGTPFHEIADYIEANL